MNQDKSKYDVKGTKTLLTIDSTDSDVLNLLGEKDIQGLRVVPFVWDTSTLTNVRMTQPAGAGDLVDIELATQGIYWAEERIEYNSSGDAEYVGGNPTLGASVSGTGWFVQKYTYTSGDVTRIQIQETPWSERTLGWG